MGPPVRGGRFAPRPVARQCLTVRPDPSPPASALAGSDSPAPCCPGRRKQARGQRRSWLPVAVANRAPRALGSAPGGRRRGRDVVLGRSRKGESSVAGTVCRGSMGPRRSACSAVSGSLAGRPGQLVRTPVIAALVRFRAQGRCRCLRGRCRCSVVVVWLRGLGSWALRARACTLRARAARACRSPVSRHRHRRRFRRGCCRLVRLT